MKKELSALQELSISNASRQTYAQGQQSFITFCTTYQLQPYPLTGATLRLYTTYLARSLSYATIQTYLAAIKHKHIKEGFPPSFHQMHLLRLLLRGIKRSKGLTARPKKLPITANVMRTLKDNLRLSSTFHESDKIMLWAAFTLAFFGFLRSSEFCAPAQGYFDPQRTLLVKNVQLVDNMVVLYIKVSKVDPFQQGQSIQLAATNQSLCPYRAIRNHLSNCRDTNGPLFKFHDNTYLTRKSLTSILQELLPQSSNNSRYTSHSFRVGAATTAAAVNTPEWLIKVLGRWSSDCYQTYIRTPLETIASVPSILASANVEPSYAWQPS